MKKSLCLLLAICILLFSACAKIAKTDFPRVTDDNEDDTHSTETTASDTQMQEEDIPVTIAADELQYYYIDAVNTFYNQFKDMYGEYISMMLTAYGLDPTLPLNQQAYDTDQSWSDYMLKEALNNAKFDYAMYSEAKSAHFSLSDTEEAFLNDYASSLKNRTQLEGYPNCDMLIRFLYGENADFDSYMAYYRKAFIADQYYAHYQNSLTYDANDIANADIDLSVYSQYHLEYFYVDTTYYSQMQNAVDINDYDLFLNLMNEANLQGDTISNPTSITLNYSEINFQCKDWVIDPARKSHDLYMTKADDDSENSYYIYVFGEKTVIDYPMYDVRHLLINKDIGDDAANDEANRILEAYNNGPRTEESFVSLVREYSQDLASVEAGGLYENIHIASNYTENFKNWATDSCRLSGDVEIIESPYGYHLMYFVGKSKLTYLQSVTISALKEQDASAWRDRLMDSCAISQGTPDDMLLSKSLNELLQDGTAK